MADFPNRSGDPVSDPITLVRWLDRITFLLNASKLKVGTFTRDISVASGTQAITGIGFQPKAVLLLSAISGGTGANIGLDNATNHYRLTVLNVGAQAFVTDITTSLIIINDATGANYATGVLQSMDADGFTVSWTKVLTPTGTGTIHYLALR